MSAWKAESRTPDGQLLKPKPNTTTRAAAPTSLRESEPVTVPSVRAIRRRTPRARSLPPPSRPGQPLVSGFPSSSPSPPSQEGKEDTSPWCADFFRFPSRFDSASVLFASRFAFRGYIIICPALDDSGLTHRRAGSWRIWSSWAEPWWAGPCSRPTARPSSVSALSSCCKKKKHRIPELLWLCGGLNRETNAVSLPEVLVICGVIVSGYELPAILCLGDAWLVGSQSI